MQERINFYFENYSTPPAEFLKVLNQIKEEPDPNGIFQLLSEPTKEELQFLPSNYSNEIGLVKIPNENWLLVDGKYDHVSIPEDLVNTAEILAHYHPFSNIPSAGDAFDVSVLNKKEFIICADGVIYFTGIKYHPFTGAPWKPEDRDSVVELEVQFEHNIINDVLNPPATQRRTFEKIYQEDFLEKMGVSVVKKTWKELPEKNPLSSFAEEV